jgi:hypothetical protein
VKEKMKFSFTFVDSFVIGVIPFGKACDAIMSFAIDK